MLGKNIIRPLCFLNIQTVTGPRDYNVPKFLILHANTNHSSTHRTIRVITVFSPDSIIYSFILETQGMRLEYTAGGTLSHGTMHIAKYTTGFLLF